MHEDSSRETDTIVLRRPPAMSLEDLVRIMRPHLRHASDVERAVVFGSYARGTADAWSDLDLVIVARTELPPTERGLTFLQLLEALPVGVDLLVYTPEEFDRGMALGVDVFARLAKEGRVVYER